MVLRAGDCGDFPLAMTAAQKFRAGIYTVEAINSFASVIYFNYLYFYFRDQFGFDNKHNLALAALIGLIYTFSSWQGGRLAARFGYFTALKSGYGLMAAGLLVGAQLHTVAGEIAVACVVNMGLCLIWPTLEALVSEGAVAADAVGLYNITWAATNALAYFIGGTLIEKLGYRSIFYIPCALMLLQLALVTILQKRQLPALPREPETLHSVAEAEPPSPARAESFKHMAWLANPFAYLAINTLIAAMPGVAANFHLSPMMAGFACSLWCFARLGMFGILWTWADWHYRFRWLAGAYALLVISFASILTVPSLPVLIVAQIFFGGAIGLIYYSSLFYSMAGGGAKSEHGGIHEAAIGMGNCIGPALGAASLQFLPQVAHSGAMAVTVLLLGGFGGLFALRSRNH
jgi:predicted MFS family arabinose efflux permease